MLAKYRCDEISLEIFNKFLEDLQPLRAELAKNQIVDDFGKKGATFLSTTMGKFLFFFYKWFFFLISKNKNQENYSVPSARYHPDVAKKTGEILQTKVLTELNGLFTKQLKLVSQVNNFLF